MHFIASCVKFRFTLKGERVGQVLIRMFSGKGSGNITKSGFRKSEQGEQEQCPYLEFLNATSVRATTNTQKLHFRKCGTLGYAKMLISHRNTLE